MTRVEVHVSDYILFFLLKKKKKTLLNLRACLKNAFSIYKVVRKN
jgi:hypothetical protein